MSQSPLPENPPAPTTPSAVTTPALSARHVSVASVNWHSVLDFTQLFRGFRLAINPAKIMIALLAILFIYIAGRTFDFAWGPQAYKGEIESFQTEKSDRYKILRDEQVSSRGPELQELLQIANARDNAVPFNEIDALSKNPRAAMHSLKMLYERSFHEDIQDAHERREKAEQDQKTFPALGGDSPAKTEQEERAAAAKALYNRMERVKETVGQGIFDAFLSYEIRQFDGLVDNTLSFVRITPIHSTSTGDIDIEGSAITGGLLTKDPKRLYQSDTVIGCIANMVITGPSWLAAGTAPMQWRPEGSTGDSPTTWGARIKIIGYRGLYLFSLAILAAFCLIVLALTGAIISRLSALEMAGVERSPLKNVFLFATRRLWIFIKAPITPFLILLAIGLVLTVAGLIGAIPFLGEIIIGIFFILILAVAFVLMLLLLGILGGFNLLYPTIAVEGSDAFDAMSRSFAYVYSRPWRLLFYSILSLIYGVITFLFVSFAIYLVLSIAHTFTGWGVNFFGYNHGTNTGILKLDTLWPVPDFANLLAPANWYAMNWSEYLGSMFLHFWVYLLICAGGAYVISYYFSSNTIIYLLLRHSVDGQSTAEIFQEESTSVPANTIPEISPTPTAPPAPPSSSSPQTA